MNNNNYTIAKQDAGHNFCMELCAVSHYVHPHCYPVDDDGNSLVFAGCRCRHCVDLGAMLNTLDGMCWGLDGLDGIPAT